MKHSLLNHSRAGIKFFTPLRRAAGYAFIISAIFMLSGCFGGNKSENGAESESADDHADNDIAMTLRSIIDAVKVGEPLNAEQYDFTGTLTDGSGRPLYTDIQGTPGAWEIKVVNPHGVTIRNLYLGDLLPEELTQYILESLNIPDSTMVTHGIAGNDTDAEVAIYDFGGGDIIFETKTATAGNGDKGPLLNIAIRGKQ